MTFNSSKFFPRLPPHFIVLNARCPEKPVLPACGRQASEVLEKI